jgi:anaerobic dimethyl sulfoxide reductase subunit B (iron-sulfur subunit)
MQFGFYFDQSRCIGCYNCVAACRSWNEIEPTIPDLIKIKKQERGRFPDLRITHLFLTCFHCEDPSCVSACPEGVLLKREEDGIVIIAEPENCTGCGLCAETCPYEAPKITTNGKRNIFKCNLCLDRLEDARSPACVAACPTEALDVGELKALNDKHGGLKRLEGFPDPKVTKIAAVFRAMD